MKAQDVCNAFKAALDDRCGCEVYAFVPPAPVLPALMVFPGPWPYPLTSEVTIIVWAVAGEVESQGAQAMLSDWASEDASTSVYAAIVADTSLGGTVSSVLPIEARDWGIVSMGDGRRVVQAQLVFSVWR